MRALMYTEASGQRPGSLRCPRSDSLVLRLVFDALTKCTTCTTPVRLGRLRQGGASPGPSVSHHERRSNYAARSILQALGRHTDHSPPTFRLLLFLSISRNVAFRASQLATPFPSPLSIGNYRFSLFYRLSLLSHLFICITLSAVDATSLRLNLKRKRLIISRVVEILKIRNCNITYYPPSRTKPLFLFFPASLEKLQ